MQSAILCRARSGESLLRRYGPAVFAAAAQQPVKARRGDEILLPGRRC